MPVLRLRNNRSSRWDELSFDIRSDEKLEVVGTKTQASHSCSQRRTSGGRQLIQQQGGCFLLLVELLLDRRKGGSDSWIFKQRCLQYAIQLSNKIFVPAQQLQRCPATAHPVRQQGNNRLLKCLDQRLYPRRHRRQQDLFARGAADRLHRFRSIRSVPSGCGHWCARPGCPAFGREG